MTIIRTLGAAAIGGALASLVGDVRRERDARSRQANKKVLQPTNEWRWPPTNEWFVILEEPGKTPRVVAGFDDYVNGEDGNLLAMNRAKELRQEDGDIWAFVTTREGVRAAGYEWGLP